MPSLGLTLGSLPPALSHRLRRSRAGADGIQQNQRNLLQHSFTVRSACLGCEVIVAGTGHRPDKLGGYSDKVFYGLVDLARTWLNDAQPKKVISGMALGWDQALAQAALDLGIPLTAAVPFNGFEGRWPFSSQKKMWRLLDLADEVHIVHPYPGSVALQIRNEWMVDRSHLMLALWDGSWGGTFNCVRYAMKIGRPVENLWSHWEMLRMLG